MNPLVIVEGVGNVHFETILLPFLAVAMMDFSSSRYLKSSVPFAGSVLVKLNPLILAPVFIFKTAPKFRFYFIMATLFILFIFIGMMEPWTLFLNFSDGMGLYFGNFEFNGSIYAIVKSILFLFTKTNPISYLAPALAITSFIAIVFVSWKYRKSDIYELALVVYFIFYLFLPIVQPWYLIPLVYLALRSHRNCILIWSYTVFLSYGIKIYPGIDWIVLCVEYIALAGAIIYEGKRKKWLQPEFLG